MRDAMRLVLEPAGFEILEAADGDDALAQIRRYRPEVVLLDLNIPGMPGADLLRAVKEDPATAAIHVVVVTAGGEEGRRGALALGADAYFTKPFGPNDLLRIVAQVRGDPDSAGIVTSNVAP